MSFFDSQSFLLMRTDWVKGNRGKENTTKAVFDGYSAVDGLLFAHTIKIDYSDGGWTKYTLEALRLNPTLDERMFKVPMTRTR